ncbi:MAG: ATP-binding protein [Vulcanimicrobiota bacterium]
MDEPVPIGVELPDGETLRISLDLGDEPGSVRSLERILSEVVRAAGGEGGLLMTLDEGNARTSSFGVDEAKTATIAPLIEQAVHELTEHGNDSPDLVLRLDRDVQDAAGGMALTVPVRSGGRSIGFFCLLNSQETPRMSPGLYHLFVDKVDITIQNARLLQRLLAERRWLEAVVQHSSDGVVILDRQGLVVGYNLTMSKLTGWTIGEAAGRPSHEVFPVKLESQPRDQTSLERLGRRHFSQRTEPVEAILYDRRGEPMDIELSGAPLFDENNQALGWVMTVRDISRRKEVERLQKLFLSAVSHELHTPIAIIKGFAGLISDPEVNLSAETIREKAGIILEESVRLEKMVGQMLEATRIQAGGIQLQYESEDLASLVRRVAQKLAPVLKAANCELELVMPHDSILVRVDSGRIQQVLTNLIENATKYGGGTPIEVKVEWDSRKVTIRVTDSGPGIAQGERERLFEAFERGIGQTVRGAGLGLYISKSIVDAHGGTIGVEEGERGGASFYFTVPRGE